MAKLGTDGPARRSSLSSPAWWTGHRQFLAADRHGPQQDDQIVKDRGQALLEAAGD